MVGAIGWAKGFAEGAHRFEPADAPTARALSRKPALAIWGMVDQTLLRPNCRVGSGQYHPQLERCLLATLAFVDLISVVIISVLS